MAFFNSLYFSGILLLSILAFHLLLPLFRNCFSQIGSALLLLLWSVLLGHFFFDIPLMVMGALGVIFVFFYFCFEWSKAKTNTIFGLSVVLILALWIFLKYPTLISVSPSLREWFLPAVGLPYIFCRILSWSVDRKKNLIPDSNLISFLSYLFFFPTLMSGPVTRYSSFQNLGQPISDFGDYRDQFLIPGLKRIIFGLIRRNFVATLFFSGALPQLNLLESSKVQMILGAYFYWCYLYFDFSGYSDLAIGTAKLLKVDVPKNFNFPFLAKNIRDFWSRWHMSFTGWLNTYLFSPLYTFFLRAFTVAPKTLLGAIAISVTFLLAGIWHGDESRYVIYGFYHAVGLFFYKIYDDFIKKNFGGFRKKFSESYVVQAASMLLTFHFVVVGFIIFSLNWSQTKLVFERLWGASS